MRWIAGSRTLAVAATLAATLTISMVIDAVDIGWAPYAAAQTDSVAPTPAPSPASGGDIDGSGGVQAAAPASPVAPAGASGAMPTPGLPAGPGSHTTNLGGSDIAVSSAGGSYEIDGPKRRSRRLPKASERP